MYERTKEIKFGCSPTPIRKKPPSLMNYVNYELCKLCLYKIKLFGLLVTIIFGITDGEKIHKKT